jgi:hypothetical protein
MCKKFTELSTEEKAKKIESVGGCALCTSFLQRRDKCNQEQRSCGLGNGNSPCTKLHQRMQHRTRVTYVRNQMAVYQEASTDLTPPGLGSQRGLGAVGTTLMVEDLRQTAMCQIAVYQGAEEVTKEPDVMLHMIYVQFPNHICSAMFFDNRSSCSIITLELAGFLGIKGRKVVQWIEVAGCDFERHKTLLYKLELTDNWATSTQSVCWELQAILAALMWASVLS